MNKPKQQKSLDKTVIELASVGGLIPIFPAGIVMGADGRGPYHLANPDAVVLASSGRQVDPVIDREHGIDLLPKGTPIKAAGWIKEFVVQDGAIFARAEWTPTAQKELDDKEYRYISPVFSYDPETREVTRIIRASLTNNPNFDMVAIASEGGFDEPLNQPTKETTEMKINPLLIALAAALGLTQTTAEDEILTTAAQRVGELSKLQTAMASVKSALKVEEKADTNAVVAMASQLASGKVDPTQFVPIGVHTELASKFSALQTETAKEKASSAVKAAIKAGKVTPAQEGWAMDYASQNLEQFNKFVEGAPVIVTASAETPSGTPETGAQEAEVDAVFCSQLGITVEDFKKQMAADEKEKASA